MNIKSTILFSILTTVTLLAASALAGALVLALVFLAATALLVRMAANTAAWLCRPLAPAYCRHKGRPSSWRSP